MMKKKRDWTDVWIVLMVCTILGAIGIGVAVELLKFVALVKYVLS